MYYSFLQPIFYLFYICMYFNIYFIFSIIQYIKGLYLLIQEKTICTYTCGSKYKFNATEKCKLYNIQMFIRTVTTQYH